MFFELGEEKFREYCLNGKGDPVMRNLWKSMDIDNFAEDLCEVTITKIKNETGTLQLNQMLLLESCNSSI